MGGTVGLVGGGNECAELLRLLMDEHDFAVVRCPNDLKGHEDIFSGGNLGYRIKGSLTPLNDQKTGHAAKKLVSDRSVLVHMVPVSARRMIFGNVDLYQVCRAGFHFSENVVGDA